MNSTISQFEEHIGPAKDRTIETVSGIALFYQSLKKLDKAEALYLRMHSSLSESRGPEDPKTLSALQSVGDCFHMKRDFSRALALYEEMHHV